MDQIFYQKFRIAGITFLLDSDLQIDCGQEFADFLTDQEPDYTIQFREVSKLKHFDMEPTAEETGFRVYLSAGGCMREFLEVDRMPYAVSESRRDEKRVTVEYLPEGYRHISHTGGAFFHIGWEDLLLREDRLILHACCVDTALGGILFSGPSGVGKSTQGNLWCSFEQARMINGDRPVLYRKENTWIACGSPYAGSSRCHVNESAAVRAIVLLKQAGECSLRRLGAGEAFRRVYAQLTIGAWNPEHIKTACDRTEQLVTEIPVYELSCTPDRDAVDLLKKNLLEEVRGACPGKVPVH